MRPIRARRSAVSDAKAVDSRVVGDYKMKYVPPSVVVLDAAEILEAMGPAHALGYPGQPPPCQNTCPMCANFCGGAC